MSTRISVDHHRPTFGLPVTAVISAFEFLTPCWYIQQQIVVYGEQLNNLLKIFVNGARQNNNTRIKRIHIRVLEKKRSERRDDTTCVVFLDTAAAPVAYLPTEMGHECSKVRGSNFRFLTIWNAARYSA